MCLLLVVTVVVLCRAWFSVDMYNLTSPVVAIELRGQATACKYIALFFLLWLFFSFSTLASSAVDLTMFWTSGAHIDGVVFVSEEMRRRILAGQSHTHMQVC